MPVGGILTTGAAVADRRAGGRFADPQIADAESAAPRPAAPRARSRSRARGCCPASCSASAASAPPASSPSIFFFSSPANRRRKNFASGDDVVLPLAQRRHLDRDDVQAVVQVLAELARLATICVRSRLVAAMMRTSTRSVRVPPRRSNSCSCSTRRILACVLGAHVADFVEEQRAAVGLLEPADALLVRAGERALLVAEQLRLEQVLLQRRAVHLHEIARRRAASCGGSRRRSAPCRCPFRRG